MNLPVPWCDRRRTISVVIGLIHSSFGRRSWLIWEDLNWELQLLQSLGMPTFIRPTKLSCFSSSRVTAGLRRETRDSRHGKSRQNFWMIEIIFGVRLRKCSLGRQRKKETKGRLTLMLLGSEADGNRLGPYPVALVSPCGCVRLWPHINKLLNRWRWVVGVDEVKI